MPRRNAIDDDALALLAAISRILAYELREISDRDSARGERHRYRQSAARIDQLRAPVLHHLALNRSDQ